MNIEKLTKEIGRMDSAFIDEALEYSAERQQGGITMSKKKIAVLVAVIAAIILTFPAAVAVSNYWNPSYFGSLEDGTAISAPKGSVKLKSVTVSDSEVAFVLNVDDSVYPFNEYTEVLITNMMLWKGDEPIGGQGSDMLHSSPDWFDIYNGNFQSAGGISGIAFDCKFFDGAYHIKFVNRTSEKHKYTFVAYALTGRNAEGKLMEIQGEWSMDFTV